MKKYSRLSSAAVVIGALRVKYSYFFITIIMGLKHYRNDLWIVIKTHSHQDLLRLVLNN